MTTESKKNLSLAWLLQSQKFQPGEDLKEYTEKAKDLEETMRHSCFPSWKIIF